MPEKGVKPKRVIIAKSKNISVHDEYATKLVELETRMIELNKMRRSDSQVGAILRLLKLPIRQTKYSILGGKEDIRQFIEDNLFKVMSTSFTDFIRLTLLMMEFGFVCFEKVFGFDGQYYYWRKFQYLPHSTIKEITTHKDGGIKHVVQYPPEEDLMTGDEIKIPVDYVLVFTNDKEGDWYGTPILRNSYGNWRMKDILIKIDAIKQDRFGVGLPIGYLSAGYTDNDVSLLEKSLRNMRSHENAYAIMPPNIDRIEIVSVGKETDVIKSIRYHDEAMSKSILGQFIDLGTSQSGNRALGETFVEVFLMSLNAILISIEETFNKFAIKKLVDLNWGEQEDYPQLVGAKINIFGITDIMNSLDKLTTAKFIKPNYKDNVHFRKHLGMEITEEEEAEYEGEQQETGVTEGVAGLFTEKSFFRQIKGVEKKIDFQKIMNDMDKMRREFTLKMKKARDKQIKSLVFDMVNKETPIDKIRIRYGDLYEGELLTYMQRSFMYGAESVRSEKQLQLSERGVLDYKLYEFKFIPDDVLELIGLNAQVGAEVLSTRTKSLVGNLYVLYKGEHLTNKEISAKIFDQMLGTGERAINDEFYRVNQSFTTGRVQQAQHEEDISGGFYSALMDGKACMVCLAADEQFNAGHEKPFMIDELPPVPNVSCEGGDRCRCIHVYEFFREAGERGEVQPINPKNLNDPGLRRQGEFIIKANPGKESYGVFDLRSGKIIASVRGKEANVAPGDALRKILNVDDKKNFVGIHNHPNGSAFSAEDIIHTAGMQYSYDMGQFYAVGNNKENIFRMNITSKAMDNISKLSKTQVMTTYESYFRLGMQEFEEKFTGDSLIFATIEANRKMAKTFGYEFTGIFREFWDSGLIKNVR